MYSIDRILVLQVGAVGRKHGDSSVRGREEEEEGVIKLRGQSSRKSNGDRGQRAEDRGWVRREKERKF